MYGCIYIIGVKSKQVIDLLFSLAFQYLVSQKKQMNLTDAVVDVQGDKTRIDMLSESLDRNYESMAILGNAESG